MEGHGVEAGRLRAELSKWRGLRRRYPKDLKARALAFARRRMAAGATLTGTAAGLGISAMTLHEWLKTGKEGKKKGGRRRGRKAGAPVLVRAEVVPEKIEEHREGGPLVVTKSGVRVEGLSIEEIAALLRGLS